jgi:hypothetical protein
MSTFRVESRCECQARLSATLDERHHVLHGQARRGGDRETAPAHSIGATFDRFDVAWMCPFCGRNTLRTFEAAGLRSVEA